MLWIPIDRALDIPLNRQIYQQIREKILRGHLHAGEKLASTRELSVELKVSRNVILEAYDQLLAEGFLIARRGAGTFVAEGALLTQQTTPFITNKVGDLIAGKEVINFRSGIPALNLFPRKTWAKISHQLWHDSESSTLGYGVPEGRIELRQTLAYYLLKTRGVECHPEQIIITSGATQAMMLVSRLLLSPNDIAIMEDPITNDIQTIFKNSGATIYPIPVDELGMKTTLLPDNMDPKLVFLTPSHQFPLGSTLPIQRRIQLIEDDYDSEFRYEGPPVSSLQGLDPELVLYIGSFSKILSPALRIGYIVLPTQLIEKCRQLKWFTDLHTPSLDQLTLSRFIQEGYMEKHITKMKKFYKSQRDFLIQCLQLTFSHKVKIFGYSTGMHLIAAFEKIEFTQNLLLKIEQFGVKVYPVEDHTIKKGIYNNRLIIGYGHLQKNEIELGVTRLFQAINN